MIDEQAVLRTRDERLVGQPAAGKDGALAWQARFATEPMRLRANATATIDWNRSVQPAETAIVLNDGQRLTGRSVGVESGKVSFQPDVSERVQVPLGRVARLELRQTRSFNTGELPAALTLPRRQASDPPTHLLFSTTGDTVRGRLLSMDAKEIRMEVRARTRRLPVDRVARIVSLSTAETKDFSDRIDHAVPSLVLTTTSGDAMRVSSLRFSDARTLSGEHATLGLCRFPLSRLSQLRFGSDFENVETALHLEPAKQPRKFEDE